jgi:predicted transcriptional regulator
MLADTMGHVNANCEPPVMPRINFTMSEETRVALEKLASSRGYSLAEVVRQSLRTELALQKQREAGYTKLLVENKRGRQRELIL